MVVALGATGRQAQPTGADRTDPVAHVFRQVFARLGSAFAGDQVEAEKSGGDALLVGGVREQIPGDLFFGKLVERQVVVERLDDVVTVRKNPHVLVAVVTDRVGEPDDIQPRHRHPLAVAGRG